MCNVPHKIIRFSGDPKKLNRFSANKLPKIDAGRPGDEVVARGYPDLFYCLDGVKQSAVTIHYVCNDLVGQLDRLGCAGDLFGHAL